MLQKRTVQKNIRFSKTVVEVLEREGSKMDLSFTEYIKFLAHKKVEEALHKDSTLINDIKLARIEDSQGKLTTLSTNDEIEDYFLNL